MNRRNFIYSAAALAGSAFLPVDLKVFAKSYTKPLWSTVNHVGPMHRASTLLQFNIFMGYQSGERQYCRQVRPLYAAPNISEQDIINEFYAKYNDNNALLTTAGVEDNYHLDENFENSFRKHPTIGQLKSFVKDFGERQFKDFEFDKKRIGEWNGIASHNIVKDAKFDGKQFITTWYSPKTKRTWDHTVKLYTIETFAREMVFGAKHNEKLNAANDQWSTKNLRKRLKESWRESFAS